MADNTVLNPGVSGDQIRTLDRTFDRTGVSGAKTEVTQLDVGGVGTNAESLVSTSNPLPAQLYEGGIPADLIGQMRVHNLLLMQVLLQLQALNTAFGVSAPVADLPPFVTGVQ